jgi:hypothetical protein
MDLRVFWARRICFVFRFFFVMLLSTAVMYLLSAEGPGKLAEPH